MENDRWKKLPLSHYMPELHSYPYYFDYKNSPHPKIIIEIAPDSNICKSFSWINFYNLKEGTWTKGCSIRAKLNISKNKKRPRYIYSNEVSPLIIPYKGIDSTAFNFLMELKLPNFLYELLFYSKDYWGFYSMYNPETFSDALEFLEKFPKSQFSPWVKLHLAYCYKVGIGATSPDTDKAKEIALFLLNNAPNPAIEKLAQELLQGVNTIDEED